MERYAFQNYAERHKVKSRAAEDFARLARDLMGGKQK